MFASWRNCWNWKHSNDWTSVIIIQCSQWAASEWVTNIHTLMTYKLNCTYCITCNYSFEFGVKKKKKKERLLCRFTVRWIQDHADAIDVLRRPCEPPLAVRYTVDLYPWIYIPMDLCPSCTSLILFCGRFQKGVVCRHCTLRCGEWWWSIGFPPSLSLIKIGMNFMVL